MKMLKRYNLGFKWFGPLEQCSDGKLIYFADGARMLRNIIYAKNNKIATLEHESKIKDSDILQLQEDYKVSLKQNKILKIAGYFLSIIIAILLAIVINLYAN